MSAAQLETKSQPQVAPWKSAGRLMLFSLLASGATFAASLPTWITVDVHDALQKAHVEVAGSDAAPGVSALALVALAAAVAVRLAQQKVRYLIVAVMVAAGCGMMFSSYITASDPVSAAQARVGTETGVIGMSADYTMTFWPWVSLATGLLVVVSAVLIGIASPSWKKNRSKYDRNHAVDTGQELDEIDTWDALSDGVDPTVRQ